VNVTKDILEGTFIQQLRLIQPKSELLELFRAVVVDCIEKRSLEKQKLSDKLQRKIEELQNRKLSLAESVAIDHVLDQETYQQLCDKLDSELNEAYMQLNRYQSDIPNPKPVIDFATEILLNADNLWPECDLGQKRLLQKTTFPNGLGFDGKNFGTVVTNSIFSMLQDIEGAKTKMASHS
jgi:hypothetical protein